MDRATVIRWVAAYERAWRTAGTEPLAELFTPDAIYLTEAYATPLRGLAEIAPFWERERVRPDEAFAMRSELVACDADERTAVVRVEVDYGAPTSTQYRDLWVIAFAADGRARHFEEWWAEAPAV